MFFLAGPDELRVEMRIVVEIFPRLYARDGRDVVVGFVCGKRRVGFGRDQSYGRVVGALLVFVFVTLDGTLGGFAGRFWGPRVSRHRKLTFMQRWILPWGKEQRILSCDEEERPEVSWEGSGAT